MASPQVLIVEDDDRIAAPLVRALEREGYEVSRTAEGNAALAHLAEHHTDLVLLDLGLPDLDGLEVCRKARDDGFTGGVIVLTARDGELDRVVGLDVGADDYMAKPFGLAELLARARALLRRSAARPAAAQVQEAAGFRVDVQARRIWVGDDELAATTKEFDVLALLDVHRGAVVSREQLINDVWDENWYGSTKTLDTTVGRLRQKLDEAGAPVQVTTVRGVGFRLEETGA